MTDTQTTAPDDGRPAGLPDKFWDADQRKVRLDALIASYDALEKKMSGAIVAPDSPEGKQRMLQFLGVPESPDAYVIDVGHGLFEPDPAINAHLHGLGCTQDQAQGVYDLAAGRMVPMIVEIANEYKADREVQRLIETFGGPDRWAEISRQLLAYGQRALPPDVLSGLTSSYEGVMALYNMMRGGGAPSMADAPDETATGDGDLQTMMRDPRYWRKRDPAFVAQVTEGFRKIYGG